MMSGNKIVRFLFVVFCVGSVVFGGSHGAVSSERNDECWPVEVFLKARNVTTENVAGDIGPTCGGRCCGAHAESALRARVRRELAALVAHSSRALHALLAATRHALHDHVMELSRQSENKTRFLFNQVYRKMEVHEQKPIASMYNDIRAYVRHNATDGDSPPQLDLAKSTMDFFTNIFPLVYYRAVNLEHKDFREDYKACLRQVFTELQPFGDIPKQISNSLSRSLEATRVLLLGLSLGSEVLNATDALLAEDSAKTGTTQQACDTALLKMTYCPKCQGFDVKVKPCSGYCLNVLRGCLTNSLSDLDSPWNSYVEAIERLVLAVKSRDSGVNADTVIRGLDTRISEVIMLAMANGPSLEKKVKSACGHARLADQPAVAAEATTGTPPRLPASPLDTQLLQFLASVQGSRGFYAGLADTLCRDSAQESACWNGEGVGEYTKTVVAASASFQRYNPEVALQGEETPDLRVARLADKLRHIRQLLLKSSSAPPLRAADSASFMQGDAAGEGSGSGRWSDDDDVAYDFEGSGEGSADGAEDGRGDDDNKHYGGSKTVPVPGTNQAPSSSAASSSFTVSPVVLCCQLLAAILVMAYRAPFI